MSSPPCPICGATAAQDLGPPVYRLPSRVAGVPIDISDIQPHWWRCSNCTFLFIHPKIPPERLHQCYAAAESGHWGTAESYNEVRSYAMKKQVLERYAPGRRALDFGCFDGGFLAYLGDAYEKFGIEPARDAARVAESRGVKILGQSIESAAQSEPMDAIVSFDVFEHLDDPIRVLRAFHDRLRPGGVAMIETGNSDHPYWQNVGKLYPYMALVEHIGAFNEKSLREAGRRTGFDTVHFQLTEHDIIPIKYKVQFACYRAAYWLLRRLDRMKLPLPGRISKIARGPLPRGRGADHFLAVLKRQ